jgi:hypothetical protein
VRKGDRLEVCQFARFFFLLIKLNSQRELYIHIYFRTLFAAEGSILFFTSPFPVRESYAAKKSFLGCLYIRKDVTEMLKNIITYSRLRFDFPNTQVETREQHCGP